MSSELPPPQPARPELRVSDDERDAVARQLSAHAGAGRLTMIEFEDRLTALYAARTKHELTHVTAGLPAEAPAMRSQATRRKPTRWLLSVMGGGSKRGPWRVAERVRAICVMGGLDLDLRHATFDTEDVTITVISIMGGADIYVPDSVETDVGGFSIAGSTDERGSARAPTAHGRSIRLRVYNLMGGTDVWRLPHEANKLELGAARRLAAGRRTTQE